MDKYDGLTFLQPAVVPQIFGIIFVTLFLIIISGLYFMQIKKMKPQDEPKKLTIIVNSIIETVKNLVIQSFGIRFIRLTPYFIFLLCYLVAANIVAIFGLKEPATSYTVPLTLGLITWFGSIIIGIKYQKLSFLRSMLISVKIKGKKIPVMINPLEILGKITPLISLTFRLWGNVIAGAIIFSVVFWVCSIPIENIPSGLSIAAVIFLGGGLLMPALFAYLSLFTGTIQAYVFVLLTMTYWSQPIHEAEEEALEKNIQQQQKIAKLAQ